MAAPKGNFSDLFKDKENSKNLNDKKIIESLKERLNDKIMKDVKAQKKAALILEQWINKKSKP
jgi:hypothetical protein